MTLLLPNEKMPYVWTSRRIFIAVLFVLVMFLGFVLMLSDADADTSESSWKREQQVERLIEAEEDQAKALEDIVVILRKIEKRINK